MMKNLVLISVVVALILSAGCVSNNVLSSGGWKVLKVSSEEQEGEDGIGSNLIDNDPYTIWHSEWFNTVAEHPHYIVIDLGAEHGFSAFGYLPRQDEGVNGTVKEYELYVSNDPAEFGAPVKKGEFENAPGQDIVKIPATKGRYVKFKILSEINGEPFGSGAELKFFKKYSPKQKMFAEEDLY